MIDYAEEHGAWLGERNRQHNAHRRSLRGWPQDARVELVEHVAQDRYAAIRADFLAKREAAFPKVGSCACGLTTVLFGGKCVGCL